MDIKELCFSTKTSNCLWNAGITTVEQLRETPITFLLKRRNFGIVGTHEVFALLDATGTPHPDDEMFGNKLRADRAIEAIQNRLEQLKRYRAKLDADEMIREDIKARYTERQPD